MPDVLIQDAPPVVVAQPGAAVCQHIMYASNSRASQNKEIKRGGGGGGGGEGRETRAKGAFKSGQGQRRDKNEIRQY